MIIIFNEAIKIYNTQNGFYDKTESKKNFIIDLSHDFLLSSHSSIGSKNN